MALDSYATLLLGVAFAAAGGELFVRGAVALAQWARVSPALIAATVAAFATSSPELSVAVQAALAGNPGIALGNALGANVANLALILGLALLISGIRSPRDTVKRDFPVALLAPAATAVLVLDGVLSRGDALLLAALFAGWLAAALVEARRQRGAAASDGPPRRGAGAVLATALGFSLLLVAGHLIVSAADGIAASLGVNGFIVGATVVALGTTTPELATTVVAKFRGHDEVGLGTLLGSNIFNGLFIVAVAALIAPIVVGWREVAAALLFGILTVLATLPGRGGLITRRRGALLLALYALHLVAMLSPAGG